jgi:very-short-patch-repair endonuclease
LKVGELAGRQWGVISVAQLHALGVGRGAIEHGERTGRLRRLYRGVYAVGHAALRVEGRWMAAVLACGPGAVLSHNSAAALWGIRPTAASRIHVSAPRGRHGRKGIALHRPRTLPPHDVTEKDGIPATTPTRTLRDLQPLLPLTDFERAAARAERAGLAAAAAVEPKLTESEAERLLLEHLRRAGLPEPEVNVWLPDVGEIKVDFLWRAERLIVEIDGFETHGTRAAFEADRARDQALTLAGYRVLRFTWRQLDTAADTIRSSISR